MGLGLMDKIYYGNFSFHTAGQLRFFCSFDPIYEGELGTVSSGRETRSIFYN
jgi:hypothetical protein